MRGYFGSDHFLIMLEMCIVEEVKSPRVPSMNSTHQCSLFIHMGASEHLIF